MIAALFVEPKGVYSGLSGVELWDEKRDARLYAGPYPAVAHPPCQRWGNYAEGGPMAHGKFKIGDDGGCFESALKSVRTYGGVLEHPENSKAWARYGIARPPFYGGWVVADSFGGWTCCVDQGWYGHRAQKTTWLYSVGCDLPSLIWGRFKEGVRIDSGPNRSEINRGIVRFQTCERLSKKQRLSTPIPFRDLLIEIASSYNPNNKRTWSLL